jgi:hypothetical protein
VENKNTRASKTEKYFRYARAVRFHMRKKTLSPQALECFALIVEHNFYFAKDRPDWLALTQFMREGRMSKWLAIEGIDELLEHDLVERIKSQYPRQADCYRIYEDSLEKLDSMLKDKKTTQR